MPHECFPRKKRKSRYGIWFDNKFKKPFGSNKKKIEPKRKHCACGCGKRVKHHHIYADGCWKKIHEIENNNF